MACVTCTHAHTQPHTHTHTPRKTHTDTQVCECDTAGARPHAREVTHGTAPGAEK